MRHLVQSIGIVVNLDPLGGGRIVLFMEVL